MSPKKITVLALGLACALPLTACGNPTSNGSSSKNASLPATVSNADLKGRTITVWEPDTLAEAYKKLFRSFESETGAKVDEVVFPDPFESNLLTKWATGARPDLMVFQSAAQWMEKVNPAKNLYDLTGQDFVKRQKFGQDKYATVINGRNYGVSLETPGVFGLWYNKQLFARWGISPPKNLAELKQVCTDVKEKDPSVAPLYDVGGDQWPTQILPFMLWADALKGGLQDKLNHNRAKWTDPAIVNSLRSYQDLMKNGCFNKNLKTATYAQQEKAFTDGSAAMLAQLTVVGPDFMKQVGIPQMNKTMGWQALSTNDDTAAWSTTFSLQLPKTGDDKREQAAYALMKYAAGKGYQQFVNDQNQVPALDGATAPATVPDALKTAYASLDDESKSAPQLFDADYGAFPTFMSELINRTKSPEQVAQAIQFAWVKSAKAQGLAGF